MVHSLLIRPSFLGGSFGGGGSLNSQETNNNTYRGGLILDAGWWFGGLVESNHTFFIQFVYLYLGHQEIPIISKNNDYPSRILTI